MKLILECANNTNDFSCLKKISFNYENNSYQKVHLKVREWKTLLPSRLGQLKTMGTQMGYPTGVLIWFI